MVVSPMMVGGGNEQTSPSMPSRPFVVKDPQTLLGAVIQFLSYRYPQAASALRQECDNAVQSPTMEDYLEKKWDSVSRLQKKLLVQDQKIAKLEQKLEILESLNARGSSAGCIPSGFPMSVLCENDPQGGITALATSPVSNHVFLGCRDASLRLWQVEAAGTPSKLLRVMPDHEAAITAVRFSQSGRYAVSGSLDGTIKLWDVVSSFTCLRTFQQKTDSVLDVCMINDMDSSSPSNNSSKSATIISSSRSCCIRLWDMQTGSLQSTIDTSTWGAAISLDVISNGINGISLVCGTSKFQVLWWNSASDSAPTRIMNGHCHVVESVKLLPKSSLKALEAAWATPSDFQRNGEALVGEMRSGPRAGMRWGPCVLSCSRDDSIRLWECETGACLTMYSGHGNWVKALAIHPDGQVFVSASDDCSIRVWDIVSGRALREIHRAHSSFVSCLSFSSPMRALVSGALDGNSNVWSLLSQDEADAEISKAAATVTAPISEKPLPNIAKLLEDEKNKLATIIVSNESSTPATTTAATVPITSSPATVQSPPVIGPLKLAKVASPLLKEGLPVPPSNPLVAKEIPSPIPTLTVARAMSGGALTGSGGPSSPRLMARQLPDITDKDLVQLDQKGIFEDSNPAVFRQSIAAAASVEELPSSRFAGAATRAPLTARRASLANSASISNGNGGNNINANRRSVAPVPAPSVRPPPQNDLESEEDEPIQPIMKPQQTTDNSLLSGRRLVPSVIHAGADTDMTPQLQEDELETSSRTRPSARWNSPSGNGPLPRSESSASSKHNVQSAPTRPLHTKTVTGTLNKQNSGGNSRFAANTTSSRLAAAKHPGAPLQPQPSGAAQANARKSVTTRPATSNIPKAPYGAPGRKSEMPPASGNEMSPLPAQPNVNVQTPPAAQAPSQATGQVGGGPVNGQTNGPVSGAPSNALGSVPSNGQATGALAAAVITNRFYSPPPTSANKPTGVATKTGVAAHKPQQGSPPSLVAARRTTTDGKPVPSGAVGANFARPTTAATTRQQPAGRA